MDKRFKLRKSLNKLKVIIKVIKLQRNAYSEAVQF
jgi:hypothetical protein